MQILKWLFQHKKKDSNKRLLNQEEVNNIVNYEFNPAAKQSYLKSNINNILILGKTGAGKTYLAKEYWKNSSVGNPLFMGVGTIINESQDVMYDQTFLKYLDNFDSLFAEHKLIIIDEFEQLFFSLPQDKKQNFINCLKASLKNPNKTVIITNQQPIPLKKLNKIAQNADYPLAEFDLILVGSLSHFAATNSYLSKLDSFTKSRNFPLYYCQPSKSDFLVYQKREDSSFKLREISQTKYIFREV